MANILFLDNIDSFSYNLIDQLRYQQNHVVIYRNTVKIQTISNTLKILKNPIIILSPGPGHPQNAGCMPEVIHTFKEQFPIIGICLGYQALIAAHGGKITTIKNIKHGKVSSIQHDNKYMFINMPNPLSVARYHSLACNTNTFPKTLTINAYYNDLVMAFRNNKKKICGFQFHPESILTVQGSQLMQQTLIWASKKTSKDTIKICAK
ncbi:anthranilate synthase component II (plasmid) [Buchnera aphidicola (Nipponaphis monzeni)]|uniref:anthranilate synthase n=1 Tax=Buchnera aphidicola (Nipponaphis monzeni) TaxID=2495405 RepID=A0A455TAU6_9GAMM|nr:aminodeoxychorismate/anthranilate synthase component II [Buchnera aphidicola]BBI01458.1 anthranilate synthase component II [Buchnera aphidicola (Nipponaphis monzeni)]